MAPRVLCDFWYGRELATPVDMLDDVVAGRPLASLLARSRWTRALTLLWLARRYDVVIPDWYCYGRLYCVLQALSARRKVMLVEFIDYGEKGSRLARAFRNILARWCLGPFLRRAVVGIQVMSPFECEFLSARYGLPRERLHFVKWPMVYHRTAEPEPREGDDCGLVFSGGRGGCDWPSLFAAAEQGRWKLAVVCIRKDLALVTRLNARVGAAIYTDLPRPDYDALMRQAAVYVVALTEQMKSSGHIRIGHAVDAMVPVVVTNIRCMEPYLIDGVTGLAVPPNDPLGLRERVDWLLSRPGERRKLAQSAFDHFRTYNKAEYFAGVDAVVQACLEAREHRGEA